MTHGYHTILIPVDFSKNTDVAVKKALALVDEKTVIHLLHVHPQPVSGYVTNNIDFMRCSPDPAVNREMNMLQKWKRYLETGNRLTIHAWISKHHSVQSAIETHAKTIGADLVVIGKKSNHSLLPFLNRVVPGMIVLHTGVAVLTVKPGSLEHSIRTIVVPVTGHVTQHKLDAIASICQKHEVKVHLVTFREGADGPSEFYATALLNVYQWLRHNLNCAVEYAVLKGYNKAMATIKYANKIHADVLLVHPESETRVGWLNSQISDVLPAKSKVQVLVVQQKTTYSNK